MHELEFPDGEPPPPRVIERWLDIVDATLSPDAKVRAKAAARIPDARPKPVTVSFAANPLQPLDPDAPPRSATGQPARVGVHCVAGLGRAPVLVAIALIEAGMDPLDCIGFIRKKRRGALNNRQPVACFLFSRSCVIDIFSICIITHKLRVMLILRLFVFQAPLPRSVPAHAAEAGVLHDLLSCFFAERALGEIDKEL